ncbi:MAG: stage III sporulation protein AE [Clostridia bacterium]|nr:stage III sporulation protein AE [Clostridia bacterium]
MQNSILEQLDELDLSALQAYVDSLEGFMDEGLEKRLLSYIKGEGFDYQNFGQALLKIFFSDVQAILPAFTCIAAISLLSGLISTLKSETNAKTTSEMIHLITYVGALIPVLAIVTECFASSMRCVSAMHKQMTIIFPLMLTLLTASGGTVSAAICRPAVGFFATTIVSLIQTVIFPITILIVAFSIVGNLTKELKISKFTAFFKSINKWIIGVCASVFGIFFTVQGITSATYDGVARRAAKYAIGNGVPIVGGFLSGGFDLAIAGSVLIKNALGSMGIALLLFVLFEPMILLIAVNLLLRLVAAITQPFGDSRISDFLGETAENLQYCMAGLLLTAFLYFLTLVMMICCTEAIL